MASAILHRFESRVTKMKNSSLHSAPKPLRSSKAIAKLQSHSLDPFCRPRIFRPFSRMYQKFFFEERRLAIL